MRESVSKVFPGFVDTNKNGKLDENDQIRVLMEVPGSSHARKTTVSAKDFFSGAVALKDPAHQSLPPAERWRLMPGVRSQNIAPTLWAYSEKSSEETQHAIDRSWKTYEGDSAAAKASEDIVIRNNLHVSQPTALSPEERAGIVGILERTRDRIQGRRDYDSGNKDYILGVLRETISVLKDAGSPIFWGHIKATTRAGGIIPAVGYFDPKGDRVFLEPALKGSTVSPIMLASALVHEVKHRMNSTAHVPSWWERHNPFSSEMPPKRDSMPLDEDETDAYLTQGAIFANPGVPEDANTEETGRNGTPLNDVSMAQTIRGTGDRETQTERLQKLTSIDRALASGDRIRAKELAAGLDSRIGRGVSADASVAEAIELVKGEEMGPNVFVIPPSGNHFN
ncbi:MAG TPA: hypothetical protein VFX30_07525 [bacterium]|nr:hypothetical protein [bacterium]